MDKDLEKEILKKPKEDIVRDFMLSLELLTTISEVYEKKFGSEKTLEFIDFVTNETIKRMNREADMEMFMDAIINRYEWMMSEDQDEEDAMDFVEDPRGMS